MAKGWIRAYQDEWAEVRNGNIKNDKERSQFRKAFQTNFFSNKDEQSTTLATVSWSVEVDLPDGIGSDDWTRVIHEGKDGFIKRKHLVEIAYVKSTTGKNAYTLELLFRNGKKKKILWGDLVQISKRENNVCSVRVRGLTGTVPSDRLTETALLETYFVDVGQGDAVIVRYPETGKHMIIDGGLRRKNQMSGRNAADFLDWKFFKDYGDYAIRLDAMVASHSDSDHYGGLWDLVKDDIEKDHQLDCAEINISTYFHPGLSRWTKNDNDIFPHKDGLGPNNNGWFTRLLGNRADAKNAVSGNGDNKLQGDWKSFIEDLINRNPNMDVQKISVKREDLEAGQMFPEILEGEPAVRTKVLAPVTKDINGEETLKDLGVKSINTNGHSICLRLDYGKARILLTGDLNKKSMEWLAESYGDRIAAFECDVAKACHHGSHDISYKFLESIKAAATIISSGDAEGHAHPRPEIVGASAVTGFVSVDRIKDKLLTPLIYMTEIERSVSLGLLSHITFKQYSSGGDNNDQTIDGALFSEMFKNIPDKAFLTDDDRNEINAEQDDYKKKEIEKAAVKREKAALTSLDDAHISKDTTASFHYRSIHKLFTTVYGNSEIKRDRESRIMTKNHYGLVNVRTDGETIMCATMKETGEGWIAHTFPARFNS